VNLDLAQVDRLMVSFFDRNFVLPAGAIVDD